MVKTILNLYGENTYIINQKKECYIIDPGAHIGEIKDYIETEGFTVLGVLLTHGHFDHTFSINEVVAMYDCTVYIHKNERDFLFDPNLNLSNTLNKAITLKDKTKVSLIDKDTKLKLGYETITVIETPGHTRGGVCYKFKRFLFSGDTLFKGTIGRYDLPTSNKTHLSNSLKLLVKVCKDNTVVYPGHGHFTTILTEKLENPFLKKS